MSPNGAEGLAAGLPWWRDLAWWRRAALTYAIAIAGVVAATAVNVPLSWMLGPFFCSGLAGVGLTHPLCRSWLSEWVPSPARKQNAPLLYNIGRKDNAAGSL